MWPMWGLSCTVMPQTYIPTFRDDGDKVGFFCGGCRKRAASSGDDFAGPRRPCASLAPG